MMSIIAFNTDILNLPFDDSEEIWKGDFTDRSRIETYATKHEAG